MNHDIKFLTRKPLKSGNFSIEGIFRTLVDRLSVSGMEADLVELPYSGIKPLNILRNLLFSLRYRNDIVVITGDVNYLAWLRINGKTLLVIHDMDSFKHGSNSTLRGRIYLFLWFFVPVYLSLKVIVVSEFTKSELLRKYPWSHSKVVVAPNFIRESFVSANETHVDGLEDEFILFIGQTANKNFKRAYAALRKATNCQLVCVANRREMISNSQIKNNELANVKCFQNLSDGELKFLYHRAQFLLFPSLYEGFGLPILEAQISGCIVLTSDVAPMNVVAGGALASVLVDPWIDMSIFEGISRLMSMRENDKRVIIDLGRVNAKQYCVNETLNVYKEIIKSCVE